MFRKFVELDKIDIYHPQEIEGSPDFDFKKSCHILKPDGTFYTNKKRDGKTAEEHLEGIKYIKEVLKQGNKILPPLVQEKNGRYQKLDGFKRLMAYRELGYKNVEVMICEGTECQGGGQRGLKLLEGKEGVKPTKTVLSRGAKGLQIEFRENVHVHWGERGWSRIVLGKRDFLELTESFKKWE